ncbi:MAG TPA: methyltransferase domain-containing protein [Aestuariivirgaceae bacterium]
MAFPPAIFDRKLLRWRRLRTRSGARFLNDLIAAELAERLAVINRPLRTILLTGPASVPLKAKLMQARPDSKIILGDILPSPGVDFVFDDETPPLAANTLEAFVYALGLESVNDVPGVFAQIRQTLKPDGVFLASVLGGETLSELRQAWLEAETEVIGGATPRVAPFVQVREWGALLQRAGFALPVVDADRHTVRYSGVIQLMHDLRALGLTNVMSERSRIPLSRRLLERVSQCYLDRYAAPDGRIPATFEIIHLSGWSPHESQPKPLRPGSAKLRLAEALGVDEKKLKRE